MCTGVEWPGTFGVLLILVGQYISLENPAGGMTLGWPYHAASMTVHCRRARCVWPCALILQWAYGHSWPYASESTVPFHSIRIVTVTGPSDERNFGARHGSPS